MTMVRATSNSLTKNDGVFPIWDGKCHGSRVHSNYCLEISLFYTIYTTDSGAGATPLHMAALSGQLEVIGYLVNQAQASTRIKSKDGGLPIHWAAEGGQEDAINYFLSDDKSLDKNVRRTDGLFTYVKPRILVLQHCLQPEILGVGEGILTVASIRLLFHQQGLPACTLQPLTTNSKL